MASLKYGDKLGGSGALALITGSDWAPHGDLEEPLKKAFKQVLSSSNSKPKSKSKPKSTSAPLPTHIDDPRLLKAVVSNAAKGQDLTRDQLVIREAVLILCQVPPDKRDSVIASSLLPIFHYGFSCTGLIAWESNTPAFTIRLRHSDQSAVLASTQDMSALLSTRKITSRTRRQLSKAGGSKIAEVTETTSVFAEFGTIELRAVGGDLVARGEVIQLSSIIKAYRYILFDGPKRGLFLVGLGFVGMSALIRFGIDPSSASVADWIDGNVSRLASAAFGAQLVNSAIDYNALAPNVTRRGIRFETGAAVKWTWVDGRTEA